jgi:hypothetical protein
LNCAELNWDGEACCSANGLMQSDDDTALCYEPPPLVCGAGETKITCGGGSYASEHSWTMYDSSDAVIASGGDPYEACHTLPAGWTVELVDSLNDGWDGASLTVGDLVLTVGYGQSPACYQSDGTACPADPGGPAIGDSCTASCYDWWSGYYDCAGFVDCGNNCGQS